MNLGQIIEAFVLGIVQGLTEFLPISSTAHLLLFTEVLQWKDVGEKYFLDAIQFGSVIAVVMYFWSDIARILTGGWKAFRSQQWQQEEWKLLVGIGVGALPALVAGLMLKIAIKQGLVSERVIEGAIIIAIASVVMATLLGLAEKVGTRKRGFESLQIKDGILVGLGQMLAIVPGVSRSGSTLTTALFLGLKRETAARFSFLLGLPTLAIATAVQSTEVINYPTMFVPLLVGIVSAFIFSYLSIAFLMRFLQRQSTWVFVWYRLGLAALLFSLIAGNRLAAF